MPIQKLYKNGNSVAVTIPKDYLENLYLNDGSAVSVQLVDESVIITKADKKLAPDVDAKFMKMVDDFVSEHHDVLEDLAKK